MTASSGGVEWSQLVKPLLAASYGSVNKQDIPEIVKAIIKSKEEILHHEEQYEPFYASFCVLAADYLASNSHQVTIGGLSQAASASKVLIQYIISHVGNAPIIVTIPASSSSTGTPVKSSSLKNADAEGNSSPSGNVTFANGDKEKERQVSIHDKYLLSGLKALCRGSGALHRPDQVSLVSAMKAAKLPPHIKTSSPGRAGDRDSSLKDGRRNRSDPSASILEQLVSPLHDLGVSRPRPPQPAAPPLGSDRETEANNGEVSDTGVDMRNLFGSRCVSALQCLGGGELLIDVCLKLPIIQKYTQRYKDLLEGKGHGFPTTVSEALSIKSGLNQIVQELSTAWRIISLPLLEPLSATRLQKLSTIAMAVLLVSLTVATAVAIITVATQGTSSSKTPPLPREDDLDIAAPSITEKALDLFNVVLNAVRSSTRAGGHHIQNLQLMGAWLLMTGMHQLMILLSTVVISSNIDKKEEKGRSPSKKDGSSSRINLAKVQQGFGVVCVALASQGITLLTGLLEDVKVEGWTPTCPPEPARLDPLETFTATERLARIFMAVPLNQLLFYMAAVAYRKACCLKRTQRAMHEGDTFSISDSTTYYEDDFSEESLGEEDDDSVIIGSWFEEPATPAEDGGNVGEGVSSSSSSSTTSSHANSQTKTPHRQNSEVTTLVPEKGEPHGFISLGSHIFLLMNNCLIESDCAYVQQYVRSGLTEAHMMVFATIIRDLDKETAKSFSGSLTTYLGPVLGLLYDEFSFALYRFTHNLIASGLLSESLQNTLLMQLNVSPWIHEGDWPLQVLPRTLSVLAQILLLRQRKDKDELKCDSDAACVLIWQRVINTLVMSIMKTGTTDSEIEDLNVEHAQLLLFLFHSLQLMQKKNVLLSVASAIVNVAPVVKSPLRDAQVLHLSRLLLIFDYLVKNLYEAPQALIDQVQWNLFKPIASSDTQQQKDAANNSSGKLYHMWQQLEENYHKHCSSDDTTMRPCFYTLTPAETNTQDAPKLDGLACSFILATPDSLRYSSLYETLVSLLSIGCQLDPSIRGSSDSQLSFLGLCSVQYAFSLAYRTLLTMPPSVSALEGMANQEIVFEGPTILHSLLWGPRAAHKVFNGWIKDGLVRQSLTTQKADSLLKSVANSLCCLQHDMKIAGHIINSLVTKLSSCGTPSFSELFILDAVLARLQVTLDEACQKGEIDLRSSEGLDIFQALKINPDQVPVSGLLQLIQILAKTTRWSILEQMNSLLEESAKMSNEALEAYSSVLAIAGNQVSFIQPCLSREHLLAPLRSALDTWNNNTMKDFPPVTAWKSSFSNDILPGETYVSSIVMGHISSLSHQPNFSMNASLKHVLYTLVTFTTELAGCYTESDKNHAQLTSTLVSLAVDATCDHVSSAVTGALTRLLPNEGWSNGEQNLATQFLYSHALTHVEKLLEISSTHPGVLDDQIINGCGNFLERILDTTVGKKALESFLSSSSYAAALLSLCPDRKTAATKEAVEGDGFSYTLPTPIIKFLVKLLQTAEKSIGDQTLSMICKLINISSWIESGSLQRWFITSCLKSTPPTTDTEDLPDGWLLLRTLASYAVTLQDNENLDISHRLLLALVPIGSSMIEECPQGMGNLPHLVNVMSSLTSSSNAESHVVLFRATSLWVLKCKEQLGGEHDQLILKTMCHLLSYISDVLCSLKILNDRSVGSHTSGISSPHPDNEVAGDTDSDWIEELTQDDDESGDEDSDDENMSNRLCTFTLTQKEFMNQHWYHCHTCRMIDGVGVCTVCAKVCHRGHDVTYAKYGSFFCDCGAKGDGSCQALVKRSVATSYPEGVNGTSLGPSSAFGVEPFLPSSLRRRTSSPTSQDKSRDDTFKHRQSLAKALEGVRDQMVSEVNKSNVGATVLQLLSDLMPTVQNVALQSSAIGSYQRTLSALQQVHTKPKVIDYSENLMVPTSGSQEGAFENVRLNYSGEQGQTIRQLVTSHMIHRVAMCVLASPGGKRQHLAVSHEKGKITVLQLSSLLKQYENAKKKLTLTRLSSAPVPFTVLSITSNPINDDFLAVCGVKDCHILTFSTSGSVSDHLVLHPHLESGNYIIRAIWLPGQQTQLALVCADFVKIYDLSVDSLSPQYYFQMPSGKIKDACFMVASDDSYHLIVMASSGYIYTQVLCEQSSAKHGPFFVTNVLSVCHPDLKDVSGEVGGGGVSIYYSHTLQLLCFSYLQGKSFLAPLTSLGENDKLDKLYSITLKGPTGSTASSSAQAGSNSNNTTNSRNSSDASNSSNVGSGTGTSGGNSKHLPQPLCQWGEVLGHPGLITCVAQNSSWDGNTKGNSPVILMVKPDSIQVQELRVVLAKSKMTDLVAIRHSWSAGHDARTTLILLCEDGSLRIFNANQHATDFWLSPEMKKESIMSSLKPTRKKKLPKLGRTSGSVMFPVDFFEHCSVMNSVEYGGNDLLQIYNVQQLKNRLNGQAMYVASTKPGGFTLEVTNNEQSHVICGVRVAVGSVEVSKTPSYVEIFGRSITLSATRSRWFDIPLTREESLQADKRLSLVFGPSTDPSGVTILDSVKIYGKTKDDFGWPEEAEEYSSSAVVSSGGVISSGDVPINVGGGNNNTSLALPLTTTDKLVSAALETLDGTFCLALSENNPSWSETIDLATKLLNFPLPTSVQHHTRTLLASLHPTKATYHNHKDSAQLATVVEGLMQLKACSDPKQMDSEAFHRLVVIARYVAVSRPQNLVRYTDMSKITLDSFEDKKNDSHDTITQDSPEKVVDSPKSSKTKTETPGDLTSDSDKTIEADSSSESEPLFLSNLMLTFWALHKARPTNAFLTSVCQSGLTYVDATISALVEIIHAFTVTSLQSVPYAVKLYSELLTCPDPTVSFSAKQALIKVLRPRNKRRRVYIPSPPRCSTPGGEDVDKDISADAGLVADGAYEGAEGPDRLAEANGGDELDEELQAIGAQVGVSDGGGDIGGDLGGALMGSIMDLHSDDDDAMVELAIALSLHEEGEQGAAQDLGPLHPGLEGLVGGLPGLHQLQGLSGQVLHSLLAAGGLQGAGNQNNEQEVSPMNLVSNANDEGEDADGDRDAVEEANDNEHFSDTTVSANGSDDDDGEGSTAATDGGSNLMRASPAEQHGSGGSESGGSVGESLGGEHNVSGRSSMYGDPTHETGSLPLLREGVAGTSTSINLQETAEDLPEEGVALHSLRMAILNSLIQKIPSLKSAGGVTSIPFFQVILMLTSDIDGSDPKDKATLENLLKTLVAQMDINNWDLSTVWERTSDKEVQLVILRLLGVMMSRSKSTSRSTNDTSLIPTIMANTLMKCGALEHCLSLLKSLLDYWRNASKEQHSGTVIGGGLLKKRPSAPAPDMSPFFLRQYVKGNASDIFAAFPHLLTEMLLRLPYQIKKLGDGGQLEPSWSHYLCEYTMTQQTPVVRRQVRKLLLFICGHKDSYRQMRDMHALDYHMKEVKVLCAEGGFTFSGGGAVSPITLPYDSLIRLVEHLKGCVEIATSRTANWQKYCLKDESILGFLMEVSCLLEEGVAPTVLQLLQAAICPKNPPPEISKKEVKSSLKQRKKQASSSSSVTGRSSSAKRASSDDSEIDTKGEEAHCAALVSQINRYLDRNHLSIFLHTFLLESNSSNVRWQAHSLILAIYKHSSSKDQEALLILMWGLWPCLPAYGRKAAQFVDLLGYFSLKTKHCEKKVLEYIDKAVQILSTQSQILAHHPNASLYNSLSSLVEFDGYYLESEPCLVCNNPEVPFISVKLSTVKVDSRFTTKTQLVKLVGSHMISRLTLRITDLKRSKMVRTLNIYYNNRSVQAVVELKNKPSMWNKAKKVNLSAGQTEVKMDFPLPIVACNLMFEYSDFYENLQASTETLLCPRCSAAVPASPGVCANCGENVYQCHKCRAINYDEKDPFLCNACGYCKYAKFDYTLHCRPCCAVDPIESEEDRKKAVFNIDLLLEKADRSYKQLQSYKPNLEMHLVRISEQGIDRGEENSSGSNHVNRAIQQLAQKYCGDCKNAFDDLSKIIQRVQASRRELVAYDRAQKEGGKKTLASPFALAAINSASSASTDEGRSSSLHGRCYGCAAAATEHCITLLRALALNPNLRAGLCKQGLIQDLLEYNLRRGTVQVRCEVRQLLCLLTKDDLNATLELNALIMERISGALNSHITSPDLALAVRHEMALLASSAKQEDSCWEHRLRCVVQIFLMAGGSNASPMVMEFITLPCLRILQSIMKPPTPPPPRKVRDKSSSSTSLFAHAALNAVASSGSAPGSNLMEAYSTRSKVGVDMRKWLAGDANNTYDAWKKRSSHAMKETKTSKMNKEEIREHYLIEKYGCLWLSKTLRHQYELKLINMSWVRRVLFNPSSRMARHVTAQMLEFLCTSTLRKKEILDLLTTFLSEIGESGESSAEFVSLFQNMINSVEWKHYLALKGTLPSIASLIMEEINHITTLEETSLNTDLSQGYALKILTELLSLFVEVDAIKRIYKGRLLGTVLSGYLSLRKLVVQRTKLIDDTQKKLLELLEDMTSGTEEETKEFMGVCVATVKQYPPDDLRTPVFIFERLCSIIYPEENDVGEFFLTLEKDPQQEDFLQGRMVGNPYSSLDPGLGPLMRDVKNKICLDCELVALLEDDNGMELLVCNKIISLDLPVKEVYKKVWLPENNDCEAMRVIYRMRGLLGDATEEFVETLDKKKEENVDNEQVYRMAAVMSQCQGLEVMLECLQRITDLSLAKPLVTVLMKLFQFCVKIRSNRERLTDPSLGAIGVLLHTLKQCLAAEPEVVAGAPGGPTLTEQILMILEATLMEASSMSADRYAELVETCGTLEDIHLLLNYVATSSRTNSQVRQLLMRVLPFLVFCHKEKMELLVGHFRPVLDFEKFDACHTAEDQAKMEAFCVFCSGIERNHIGNQLKDMIIRANIVKDALSYLEKHTPKSKKLVVVCDDEWKEYISKPSLKYILRLLTGLAWKHPGTQRAVSQCIPSIHSLEQISSDEHVGSLAENLLEALRDDPSIAKKVQETRQLTRQEKKQLAMKTRRKELEKLGLRANEKEQITSESSLLQQMEDITEESGLVCAICLEGYRCQPQKVLAIYTFSKRCILEEHEGKSHKTLGYCTVSHFNVVHVDCHLAAVRATRSRDEWDSAALHNANTKANGLLPLWGPQVPESAFASCLARHNTYLQESTTHRDIGYISTIQDLKLLLLRFASEKSFSDDSGGGGPQSNMNLIPYVLHMALYVLNTTRSFTREEKRIDSFLDCGRESWVESAFEAEGPFFISVLALAVMPSSLWRRKKLEFLKRLLLVNHVRAVCGHLPPGGKVHDKSIQEWSTYKGAAIFWALVDNLFRKAFKNVSTDSDWSISLAEFIRHNDQALLEALSKILSTYQDDLVPSASFDEFCDVADLLGDIESPGQFLSDLLQSLP